MKQSLSGMELNNRYQLREQIGAGGMGEVYRAQDTRMLTGREVAIKVITLSNDSKQAESEIMLFEREIKAITQLNHPHILSIFDYGILPVFGIQLAYIVMPLCQYSLDRWQQRVHNADPLSLQDTAHFLLQAASALQEAHNHNIVHKDVKLQNFLVPKNVVHPHLPSLLLTDFGVAKLNTATVTVGNLPRGTPAYMPCEQWEGMPVAATDQYALAVMTYKLLTGHFPYQSDELEKLKKQHCDPELKPKPLSEYKTTIPPIVDDVVLTALSKKPEHRYPSITDFAEALQKAVRRTEKGEDIHMILTISETEAMVGTECSLTLPGNEVLKVAIPAGMKNGQTLSLEGKGKSTSYGGPPGTLHIPPLVRSEPSEEEIVSKQLYELKKDLNTLKNENPKQLYELKKDLNTLKNNNFTYVQKVSTELQAIAKDLLSVKNNYQQMMKAIVSIIITVSIMLIIVMISTGFFIARDQQANIETTADVTVKTALRGIADATETATAAAEATATAIVAPTTTAVAKVTATAAAEATATAIATPTATAITQSYYQR